MIDEFIKKYQLDRVRTAARLVAENNSVKSVVEKSGVSKKTVTNLRKDWECFSGIKFRKKRSDSFSALKPLTDDEISGYKNMTMNAKSIADARGCNKTTVGNMLRATNDPEVKLAASRHRGVSIEKRLRLKQAAALVLEAQKTIVIAMITGISESTVKNMRKELADLAGVTTKELKLMLKDN